MDALRLVMDDGLGRRLRMLTMLMRRVVVLELVLLPKNSARCICKVGS
jgi:hypothetical protein